MRQNAGARAGGGRRVRGGLALGAVVAAVAFVLAACGSSGGDGDDTTTTGASGSDDGTTSTTSTTPDAAPGELTGSFVGTDVVGYDPVPDSQLTLTFEDGQLSVNAGCNTMGAGYTFEDGTLTWTGVPRATMMACDEALTAQDGWLSALFTGGVDAVLDGSTLTLTSGDVEITLEQVADAPITGTTWTLEGTIANEAVSSLPAGADPPTLAIDDAGKVAVFAGCNRGSSTVEVAEATLTFSAVALTRMACEEPQSTLENQVVAVLDGEVDYVIDGGTLTITNGDAGLVYRAG